MPCFLGGLGDLLADHLGRLDVAAVGHILAHVRRQAAGRRQRDAGQVVDQLGVNVLGAAEHRQPRPLRSAGDACCARDCGGGAGVYVWSSDDSWSPRSAAAGEGLAFLAADLFVLVADALALVRFRLAHVANLRRELADLLLVRSP